MSDQSVSVKELFDIGEKYFGKDLLNIEIHNCGVHFVWIEDGKADDSSAFLDCPLKELSYSAVSGFLDAELKEPNYSEHGSTH